MRIPQTVLDLIRRFEDNRQSYRAAQYNEAQVREEFINPFFEALGWDVRNTQGYSEKFKEVIHEDALKIRGATKAPDYAFRIGGRRVFFVEAKKPSVNVKEDVHPAYQLRRYAWSAKLPLSILTDFEEFAVYDCRVKPVKTDKAATARIMYLTYRDYVDHWDELVDRFSPEAIRKGAFDRYVESTRVKRGTAEVDAAFLAEIEDWRDHLARNIALRNPGLAVRQLNFAVQKTIDRFIFLRIAEDRGIEPYGRLRDTVQTKDVYRQLGELFRQADNRYNAGLFHFREEKDRKTDLDAFTLGLTIDDKILKDIVESLYYPACPYQFDMLPANILGQVYEQFLGRVIRLTPAGRAKVEEKPEVKKAGGVYYTPTYIVDYIVEHTVGELLKDRTWRQARGLDARNVQRYAPLRILDPACGSGTFLLQAYQYLLDWYLERYTADNPQTHVSQGRLMPAPDGDWQLTIEERKRILTTHLHGVDIDPQAVEVTKLSLLLKVLEGETDVTLGGTQLAMSLAGADRVLPDLSNNIRCGNSLIGSDYYQNAQLAMDFLDEETMYRINAFDWDSPQGFGKAMAAGGFDAVIGNPPYVDVKLLGSDIKQALSERYSSATRRFDLYVPFVEKGLMILKKEGLLGYILPSMFARREYGRSLRKVISDLSAANLIVDFGTNQIFHHATNYVGIFILEKGVKQQDVNVIRYDQSGLSANDIAQSLDGVDTSGVKSFLAPAETFTTMAEWYLLDTPEKHLNERMFSSFPHLSNVFLNISEGIHSGKDAVFFVPSQRAQDLHLESPPIFPLAKGQNVHRYEFVDRSKLPNYVIYPYDLATGDVLDESTLSVVSPNVWSYLKGSRNVLKGRAYFDRSSKLWYELWCPRQPYLYTTPKIIGPEIACRGQFTLSKNPLFINNKLKAIIPRASTKERLEYLLGVLNSSLIEYLHRLIAPPKDNGYYEVKTRIMGELPIRTIDFDDPADVARHDRMVALVERMLDLHRKLAEAKTPQAKRLFQQQIDVTDKAIDRLVYELYDLTEEEIAIVEG